MIDKEIDLNLSNSEEVEKNKDNKTLAFLK